MKIAIAYEAGSVAKSLGTCQEFLIVTAQDGQPTGKELVTCSGEGHVRLLGFIGQYAVDVLICGESGHCIAQCAGNARRAPRPRGDRRRRGSGCKVPDWRKTGR